MGKGYSLHIGMVTTDPEKGPKVSKLWVAERDVISMYGFARYIGYHHLEILISKQATKECFIKKLEQAAETLLPGDTFLLTYSGHGGQQPVGANPSYKEDDGKDEKIFLFDDQMLDNELAELWPRFKAGVRIIVVTACCHSRTNIKYIDLPVHTRFSDSPDTLTRGVLNLPSHNHYLFEYKGGNNIQASILHLSACRDDQQAETGEVFSKFTGLLLEHTREAENYVDLIRRIGQESGANQEPGLGILGKRDDAFIYSKPFTIQ